MRNWPRGKCGPVDLEPWTGTDDERVARIVLDMEIARCDAWGDFMDRAIREGYLDRCASFEELSAMGWETVDDAVDGALQVLLSETDDLLV
jgi:hypothetical protein